MNHYMQLHKTSENGQLNYDREAPHVMTGKRVTNGKGNRVWLISREGQKAPFSYFMRYTFIIDDICIAEPRLSGRTGIRDFAYEIQLDFEPWLREFREKMNNFRFGFARIPDEFVDKIEALAASKQLPAPTA